MVNLKKPDIKTRLVSLLKGKESRFFGLKREISAFLRVFFTQFVEKCRCARVSVKASIKR